MRAAIDLASIHSSREHSTADLVHLAPCILQGMVQPVEEAQPGTAKCRQLSNERPFWQQRTFSMASSTIVQVALDSQMRSCRLPTSRIPMAAACAV